MAPSILPYVIVFAILVIIAMVAATWTIYQFNLLNGCNNNPNIWCADNYTCNNSCPNGVSPAGLPVSPCFTNVGPTGLASCLFGPDSLTASVCLVPPDDGGTACDCPTELQSTTNNCFTGCPSKFSQVDPSTVCCVKGSTNPACLPTNN